MDKQLNFPTWQKILIEYYHHSEIKSVMKISSDLDTPVTHASHITRKMVECGILTSKKGCVTDERINILKLTDIGKEIAKRLIEIKSRIIIDVEEE
jgi:DNA-binding MarR family transcriptional regulator